MACGGGCGGKKTATVTPEMQQNLEANGEMLLLNYIGSATQKHRLRSKAHPREQYIFSGDQRKFLAYRQDVAWLTAMSKQFKLAEPSAVTTSAAIADIPVLHSDAKPIMPVVTDMPIDVLTIDPITLGLLRRKFKTIAELRNAGRAEWLTIKGIGASRADAVNAALSALMKV